MQNVVYLHLNQIPGNYYDSLDKLLSVWRFMFDIITHQEFTNVNLGDNITVAISMTSFIVAGVAAFVVPGAQIFDPDVVEVIKFLIYAIQYLNNILYHLDNVITNLPTEGVLADRALDQYTQLHAVGTNLMQQYTSLADHINLPADGRMTFIPFR